MTSSTRERKWLQEKADTSIMLNSRMGLFNLSRVKDPLVRMSASRFGCRRISFGIFFFGSRFDPVKQPIKSYCVGAGYVSHRPTPTFKNHIDHCFIILKDV